MEKIRVLLIDDDEDDYIITKEVFGRISDGDKYELTWVDTFEQGITAIVKRQYDIYLVDYRLGKETGITVLSEAQAYGITEPIIILTGKGDHRIDQEAMHKGAADYLVKDQIEPDTLDRSLRYALKQRENLKALSESELKFRVLFDKAKEPILISDYTGKIHDINKAGLDLFGVHQSDVEKLNDRSFFVHAEDRNLFIEELEKKGAVSDFECEMVSSLGQVHSCSLSSSVQIDTRNMIEIYHTIIHDLTYRKGQETISINKGKVAVSEHIAKGMAEQIRDPLSAINLALYELSTDESLAYNENIQANLELIKSNLDQINQLTKNFLTSTEFDVPKLSSTNINTVIDEALTEVSDLIMGQRIELQNFLLPNDCFLNIDAQQIKKAVVNLLESAIDNMDSYPKILSLSSINESGKFILLIEDNGLTLPNHEIERLFEPFANIRGDASNLGLAEAERIVLTHGGQLSYKPQHHGNMMVMELPI